MKLTAMVLFFFGISLLLLSLVIYLKTDCRSAIQELRRAKQMNLRKSSVRHFKRREPDESKEKKKVDDSVTQTDGLGTPKRNKQFLREAEIPAQTDTALLVLEENQQEPAGMEDTQPLTESEVFPEEERDTQPL